MAAPIQAEKTSAKAAWAFRRALGIVVAVVLAHAVLLAALTLFTPKPIPLLEQPKPIAVRFVEITPPKPEQPIPPKPKPKELPKKTIKPKEVKVVKPEAKPEAKPKPKPKTVSKSQKVVNTKTASEQQQAKVTPINEEIKSKTEPETKTKTQAEETKAKAKPEPEKRSSSEPVLVEGVSYVKPPRLSITDRDLKGQARTIRLKINISTSGKVEAVQVVSSSGIAALDQKVANALKRATFTPHRVNGVAVPSYTIQPFELNLPK